MCKGGRPCLQDVIPCGVGGEGVQQRPATQCTAARGAAESACVLNACACMWQSSRHGAKRRGEAREVAAVYARQRARRECVVRGRGAKIGGKEAGARLWYVAIEPRRRSGRIRTPPWSAGEQPRYSARFPPAPRSCSTPRHRRHEDRGWWRLGRPHVRRICPCRLPPRHGTFRVLSKGGVV